MKVNGRHCSFYYVNDPVEGSISFEGKNICLLIIDMQNYFLQGKKTYLTKEERKKWEYFYHYIDETAIPNNEKILHAFREKKIRICHAMIASQLSTGEDRSLSQKEEGFNNLLLPKNSYEAEIVQPLQPIDDEIVVQKTTDSAITGTNLRLLLNNMGITDVVVTDVFTDQCVSGSVRSLSDESFRVWLIEDATMSATEEIKNHELEILNNIYCNVINTEELLEALADYGKK